jgi:hypothetical protein
MEATATVKSATHTATAESTATREAAAMDAGAATNEAVRTARVASRTMEGVNSTSISDAAAIGYSTPIAAPVSGTAPVSTAPVPVIPRAGADEDAAHKPARAIVAIGGTCVRVIRIVAPGAYRWANRVPVSIIAISDANPDPYLRMSGSRYERGRDHEGAEQQKIS